MTTKTVCKAKNPALCPYHGNMFYSKESLSKALDKLDIKKELIFKEEDILNKEDYLRKQASFRKTWSDDEYGSIYAYVEKSYKVINLWLSDEKSWLSTGIWPEKEARIIKDLDALIQRYGKNEEEQTFYRGIANPALVKGFKKGTIFSNPSFMSTTSDPLWATNFVLNENPIILKIKTKQGTPISLDYPMEYEYLLARNTQFKVASVTKKVKWTIPGNDFKAKHSKNNVTVIELIDLS